MCVRHSSASMDQGEQKAIRAVCRKTSCLPESMLPQVQECACVGGEAFFLTETPGKHSSGAGFKRRDAPFSTRLSLTT